MGVYVVNERPGSSMPAVTIVIVNWNKRKHVINLLDSLRSIEYDNYSIVIVDNASSDDSVVAIRGHELPLLLLENRENLGGTGGFNAGMNHAIGHLSQDYIWLLDNDAEVLPGTLGELVALMERDKTIGIAGSCIMCPEDHGLIVEAGAFVGWRSGTSDPHLRYHRIDSCQGARVIDVDSVAACSALVRAEVVRRVGVMDERFFLHWDDIDYCIKIRNAGFRVVASLDAPVFHGAEKGYSPITLYYDFRNALLFQAKHRRGCGLLISVWNILGNYLSSLAYLILLGQRKPALYLFAALRDFMNRRFGRAPVSPAELAAPVSTGMQIGCEQLRKFRKILLFAVGSFDDVATAVRGIKECEPSISITVAVAADRAEVYRLPEVDALIRFDLFRSGLRGKLTTAWAILGGGFQCGVTAGGPFVVPYAFLLRRNLHFDLRDRIFRCSGVSLFALWKVPITMVTGTLLAALFLVPVAWICRRLRKTDKYDEPVPSGGTRNLEKFPE